MLAWKTSTRKNDSSLEHFMKPCSSDCFRWKNTYTHNTHIWQTFIPCFWAVIIIVIMLYLQRVIIVEVTTCQSVFLFLRAEHTYKCNWTWTMESLREKRRVVLVLCLLNNLLQQRVYRKRIRFQQALSKKKKMMIWYNCCLLDVG